MTHAEKEIRNKEIVALRKSGQSMNQISEVYGITMSAVWCICKRYGVGGRLSDRKAHPQVYRNQYTSGSFDRVANAVNHIESCGGFEYAGNFTGTDGFVDIRCKKCGTVQTKSMVSIRHHKKLICPLCTEREKKDREAAKAKAAEEERNEKKRYKFWNQDFAQIGFKVCPVCLQVFIGNRRYCSTKCRENNRWKLKDGYRNLFPLQDVYERDNGVCYLCGEPCDWNDYEEKDGVIVYGNRYPSRDHIIPKSRGGCNSWDNIRLAHRICNSLKADSPLV